MNDGDSARAVSVDLGWSESTEGRNAAAFLTRAAVRIHRSLPNDNLALSTFLRDLAEPGALVLLDIPIDGGPELLATRGAFREIDLALLSAGIPLYPSSRAIARGEELRRRLAGYSVYESYPYAILRALWALVKARRLSRAVAGSGGALLDESVWRVKPPRYKRGSPAERRRGLEAVYGLLTASELELVFNPELPHPDSGISPRALSDIYDACLGLVPACLAARGGGSHPLVWVASGERGGAILLLADAWLRERVRRPVRWASFELYNRPLRQGVTLWPR